MTTTRKFALLVCFGVFVALPLGAQWDQGGYGGDVPYVPTPQPVVDAMLKIAGVAKNDIVYDLGCGDGRIVVTAAKTYGAHGTGFDLNPERIKEANENARQAGVAKLVKFVEKNLFETDLREASVVTLYLLPDVNLRLRPKLLRELKVGSRIVSHAFDMGDWKPDKKIEADNRVIYFWVVTEKARAEFAQSQPAAH
jgi:SAM-dependent methyltransferase